MTTCLIRGRYIWVKDNYPNYSNRRIYVLPLSFTITGPMGNFHSNDSFLPAFFPITDVFVRSHFSTITLNTIDHHNPTMNSTPPYPDMKPHPLLTHTVANMDTKPPSITEFMEGTADSITPDSDPARKVKAKEKPADKEWLSDKLLSKLEARRHLDMEPHPPLTNTVANMETKPPPITEFMEGTAGSITPDSDPLFLPLPAEGYMCYG